MAYQGHEESREGERLCLRVDLADPESGPATTYVTVWRRPGEDSAAEQTLPIPHLKGGEADISVLFPQHAKTAVEWRAGRGELTVHLPEVGTACLIAIARA